MVSTDRGKMVMIMEMGSGEVETVVGEIHREGEIDHSVVTRGSYGPRGGTSNKIFSGAPFLARGYM